MKPLLYIETSVVSYLTGRSSRDTIIAGHQVATQELWSVLWDKFSPQHINNPTMKRQMRVALLDIGYVLPEICSPDELLEVDDE